MSPKRRRFPPVKTMGGDADISGGRGAVPGGGVSAWLMRDGDAGEAAEGVGGALGVTAIGVSKDATGKDMSSTEMCTAIAAGNACEAAGEVD